MPDSSLPQNKSEEVGSSKGVNPKVLFGSILFFGFLALTLGGFKIWRDLRLSGGLPAGAGEPAQAGQTVPAGSSPQFNELTPPAQGGETSAPPPDLSKMTPQELRTLLLATGQVTEDQLKLIDDATLMQMYQETLKEQEQTVQQQGQQP